MIDLVTALMRYHLPVMNINKWENKENRYLVSIISIYSLIKTLLFPRSCQLKRKLNTDPALEGRIVRY